MNLFERYLTVWVAFCIVIGVALGQWFPDVFQFVGRIEAAHINLPVAVLVWLMIIPMLIKIDLSQLKGVRKYWRGVGVTLFVNWGVKPFSMALLSWFFIGYLFLDLLPADQIDSYIAGLVILAAAPCTAMVFVWSHLMRGEPHFTLSQVALNDVIMVFAFAPITAFLLGMTDITVPWETLLLSVVLYVLLPLVAGAITRKKLDSQDDHSKLNNFLATVKPWSIVGLISTVGLLFGFQAQTILDKPEAIVMIAIPLIIQTYGIFFIAYALAKYLKLPHNVAAPACMIGTSNFFELAVAVAISLFGLHSGAALATVVGVLVEVPVMLSLVYIFNRTQGWFGESHV